VGTGHNVESFSQRKHDMPELPVGRQQRNYMGMKTDVPNNGNLLNSAQRTKSLGVAKNDLNAAASSIGNGLKPSSSH